MYMWSLTKLITCPHLAIDQFHAVRYRLVNKALCLCESYDCTSHAFVFNNYDRSCTFHSVITVNTFCACVVFAASAGKLSYLFIVLMGHTMVVNIQYYFLCIDVIPKWLTRDMG